MSHEALLRRFLTFNRSINEFYTLKRAQCNAEYAANRAREKGFDVLIEAGRLRSSIEIYNELEKKDDELFAWCKERKESMFAFHDCRYRRNAGENKISDVCNARGITCCGLADMIEKEDWKS